MTRSLILSTIVMSWTLSTSLVTADDFDWTYWRGPQMNGHSTLKNLPAEWNPKGGEGSNVVWKREDLGTRSTPVVMNGKLYMLCRDAAGTSQDGEKVVCLDAHTGETLWENKFNVYLSDVPAERVGWSNVSADPTTGDVFALGVCGLFQCINGETGETKWSHSMHEEYGLLSTYGGRTNFPIIHENNVIVSAIIIGWGEMAKPNHRFIAFDKRNGQPVWFTGTRALPDDTTYSGPVLTTFNGEAALVSGGGDGAVHAFQPRTGKLLWTYNVSGRGLNTTPLVVDNRVYCGHGEENLDDTKMGAVFCVDGTLEGDITKSGEIWRTKEVFLGRSAPLMIDDRLYVIDDRAKMHILNPESGEEIALQRLGTAQRSSPLYADGKIYAATADKRWYTLKPTEDGVEVLHKMRLNGESHGSPIAAAGHVYIPLTSGLYCIGNADAEVSGDPIPEIAEEADRTTDATPTHVQVVPCESLLRPGNRQPFQVRLYDAAGQYVRLAKADEVEFSVDGPGSISEDGAYSISANQSEHAAVIVTAKVGDLSGTARARVVPDLNWSFDFNNGEIPVTWVGANYRHVPLDFDLIESLKADDPLASQLYIFLMTTFVNSGRDASTYDDSTPRQTWNALLAFLGLDASGQKPKTVDEAKEKLQAALDRLIEEKILASAEWSTWQRDLGEGNTVDEIRLSVTRGERKIDGNGVMTKIKTIPKGARSQGWMGHPDLANYTIQADVYGAEKDSKQPDIGLVGQRYTLDMMGASQQLQIRTWTPQLRMANTVPFEWQPNTWYTMKFQTAVEDGSAVLRGKVWKKGEEEPADWTVTATDSPGEHQGSPGLFGNAKDAEIFYDNLTVTANESTGD